ncbi:hypothetical protein DFR67_103445 [Williamsia limnetica]|uniref:DUF2971 family protein n=1 Tax=Williamsia limnetica TaxID=882452 RepID=A0A318RMJ2_WILLI|nr:hypothetical protein [Williamsia limnetica]PYE19532.1 hypothetical protein DFR67_103445 [Williamsia limnetica]
MYLDLHEPDAPDLLYHYTTASGLLGIVDRPDFTPYRTPHWDLSRALMLRATDVGFLGNGTEYRNARTLLLEEIDRIHDASSMHVQQLLNSLTRQLDRPAEDSGARSSTYAARFSVDGDSAAKWRGLPATGGRYAIGFDVSLLGHRTIVLNRPINPSRFDAYRLEPDTSDDHVNFRLRAVHYGNGAVRKAARAIVKKLLDTDHHAVDNPEEYETCLAEVAACLRPESATQEQEWRILFEANESERTEFRSGSIGLVPYRNLAIIGTPASEVASGANVWGPINRLHVGPGPHQAIRMDAAKRLLAANKIDPNIVYAAGTTGR